MRTIRARTLRVVLPILVVCTISGCQSYDRQEVVTLIEKLGSEDLDASEKARAALFKMGNGPFDLVVAALKDESAQRRLNAMHVIVVWDGPFPRKSEWDTPYQPVNLRRALGHDDLAIRYQAAILSQQFANGAWEDVSAVLQQAAQEKEMETYDVPVAVSYSVAGKSATTYNTRKVPARIPAIGVLWDRSAPQGPELIMAALKTPDKALAYYLRAKLSKQNAWPDATKKELESALLAAEEKLGLTTQQQSQ